MKTDDNETPDYGMWTDGFTATFLEFKCILIFLVNG